MLISYHFSQDKLQIITTYYRHIDFEQPYDGQSQTNLIQIEHK